MRAVLTLLFAAGCSQPLYFEHVSTLTHDTSGVVLHGESGQATAGMADQVCTVQTTGNNAGVLVDYDFTDEREYVDDLLDGAVLARSPGNLHFIDGLVDFDETISAPGVRIARLSESGVVFLSDDDGCAVVWQTTETATPVAIDDDYCADGVAFDIDPLEGIAYLAGPAVPAVLQVTPEGSTELNINGEFIAVDPLDGTLYVGEKQAVSAFDAGNLSWEAEVKGELLSVATYGAGGAVIIGTKLTNGHGWIDVFDNADGQSIDGQSIPEGGEVLSSDDGEMVVVVLDDEAQFFTVTEDGKPPLNLAPDSDSPTRFID